MPLRVFPVAGTSTKYSDDFGAPRSGGRTHQGNDLFDAIDKPLLAVDDGLVHFGTDPLGGNIATLKSPDGTRYYFAHLNGWAGDNDRQVQAGDVIGYLGKTGNAAGTPSHLHFEVHPDGGDAINPFPLLQAAQHRAAPTKTSTNLVLVALALGGFAYLGTRLYYSLPPSRARLRT